jgi:precorrin-2 dehydrogenase / sirohydrochlorin ferrochelatase
VNRPDESAGLPLLVDLRGRGALVVGAGPAAAAKTRSLLDAGACVTVVAPAAVDELVALADQGRITWCARPFAATDVDGAWIVVAATSDPAVNATVEAEAEERHRWCVRADDAAASPASLLAAVRRGPLLLAVSTSGSAPALSAHLRRRLAEEHGPEWGQLADLMGELRVDPEVRSALAELPPSTRRARWHGIIDPGILYLIRSGRRREAKEVAKACLCSSSD